jgi:protease I
VPSHGINPGSNPGGVNTLVQAEKGSQGNLGALFVSTPSFETLLALWGGAHTLHDSPSRIRNWRMNVNGRRRLNGRRIAVLAADGFEKIELVVPVAALRLEGAKVDIVSLRRGRIRGVNLHEPASRVRASKTVHDADPSDYDGLFVPGGLINPDLLRQSAPARNFVRAFEEARKPIATLCHGPWVLASAGLVDGRTMTSWPGVRDDMVNAGATWLDQPVVRDGNLVTSRGPQDLRQFVPAIIDLFAEPEESRGLQRLPASASAPQYDEPPKQMLQVLRWAPKPSLRTAVAFTAALIGLTALGLRQLNLRRR